MNVPRLVVAGLSGDSGKTLVSLSAVAALRRRGLSVSAFKKGPDYIDAAWLSWIAGVRCRNLDSYMVDPDDLLDAFVCNAAPSGISVIEGNRGLFDGHDVHGTHSTASLAKLLKAPVVLVVNCSKTTRTIAALVNGCMGFDPEVEIVGIVLNKVAGKRHQAVIADSIQQYCGVPILGAVPRLGADASLIPGRHLGLVTPSEFQEAPQLESKLQEIAEEYLDVDRLIEAAGTAGPLRDRKVERPVSAPSPVQVGYFRDTVFTFYYPENLEALEAHGAQLVPVSSLSDSSLPEVDALYIGGGFPEVHAERLADNHSLMKSVRESSAAGLPIYAECGGLIYLCRSVESEGKRHRMAGVFDVDLRLDPKPIGHGYASVRVDRSCPFFPMGTRIAGHEFHYTGPITPVHDLETCMAVERGIGLGDGRDGLVKENTVACYTHLHALGIPSWASEFTARAREYRGHRGCDARTVQRNGLVACAGM